MLDNTWRAADIVINVASQNLLAVVMLWRRLASSVLCERRIQVIKYARIPTLKSGRLQLFDAMSLIAQIRHSQRTIISPTSRRHNGMNPMARYRRMNTAKLYQNVRSIWTTCADPIRGYALQAERAAEMPAGRFVLPSAFAIQTKRRDWMSCSQFMVGPILMFHGSPSSTLEPVKWIGM
jgi:hypothetical protein